MITGKGFYIWNLPEKEIGAPADEAAKLKADGFDHVLIKIADGAFPHNSVAGRYIEAFRAAGIQVAGWQYVYGTDPVAEALMGIRRVVDLGLSVFVIDAEKEIKGRHAAADRYMREIRGGLKGVTLALSSYRFPSLHPEFPWSEFMGSVDYAMPQVYWAKANNPAKQLDRCVSEYRSRWPSVPIIPTGAAYQEAGWKPTPGEIEEFWAAARKRDFIAVNFWELANSRRYGLYETVSNLTWDCCVPEPEPEPVGQQWRARQGINIRVAPSLSAAITGSLIAGQVVHALDYQAADGYNWVRHSRGWSAMGRISNAMMEAV